MIKTSGDTENHAKSITIGKTLKKTTFGIVISIESICRISQYK